MGQTTPLLGSEQATVAANGRGSVRIGADKPFKSYRITYLSVQNDGQANAVATIYRGTIGPTTMVESSPSGNEDITDTLYSLLPGEFITVEWTSATPGSRCLAVYQGTQVHA